MKYTLENGKIRGSLRFDEIQISPNEQNGYRPFELFISSLVGCSGVLLGNILQKKRKSYKRLDLEASAMRNPDQANRIEQISITAIVQLEKPLSQEQADKIADLVVKNCGMIQSIIESIKITFTVKPLPLSGD